MNDCLYRFDEDYSYLRKRPPGQKKDFFDALKFIPLDNSGDVYLTFNGNERIGYYHNLLFNTPNPAGDANELDLRTDLGVNLQIGSHVRVYADLWNAHYFGPNADPSPVAQNTLTTENAFVEFMGQVAAAHVGVRIGRQFLWLGDNGLVVGDTELATLPNTWDGVRAYANWGHGRIDAFWMEQQTFTDGVEAGSPNSQVQLYGAYGTFDLPSVSTFGMTSKTALDLYYIGYKDGEGTYNDSSLLTSSSPFGPPSFVVGNDNRNTFGVRYHGKLGPFDFDETAEDQGGDFAGKTVSAWMFATNNGYTFADLPLQPRIGVQFDGASGGASGNSIHTYQPLYYSSIYYNASLLLSPTNFIDIGPHLVFHPRPGMLIDLSDTSIWRENDSDAIYNGLFGGGTPINVYSATANIKGSYTGNQVGGLMIYALNKHVDILAQLAYFFPGQALQQIGASDKIQAVVVTTFKF